MIKKTNTKTNPRKAPARPANNRAKSGPASHRSASLKEAVKSAASESAAKREVTFAVYEPGAEQVFVSGAFNDWQTTPLTKRANRDWTAKVALAPGRYEYKFVVDGKWKIDPRARQFSPNGFGTLNSVIEVKA